MSINREEIFHLTPSLLRHTDAIGSGLLVPLYCGHLVLDKLCVYRRIIDSIAGLRPIDTSSIRCAVYISRGEIPDKQLTGKRVCLRFQFHRLCPWLLSLMDRGVQKNVLPHRRQERERGGQEGQGT